VTFTIVVVLTTSQQQSLWLVGLNVALSERLVKFLVHSEQLVALLQAGQLVQLVMLTTVGTT